MLCAKHNTLLRREVVVEPKPFAFTPYLQASVAVAALVLAASAAFASYTVWNSERNARLVEIGVSILRADPKKEPSTAAARKWALDLIDANAGGVRFSAEARKTLVDQALPTASSWYLTPGYDAGEWKEMQRMPPPKQKKISN